MSKQQAAPGELELVRGFVNTADLEQDVDRLADRGGLGEWLAEQGLAEHGLRVTRAEHARAIELREALRAILLSHNGRAQSAGDPSPVLDRAAKRARLRLRFDERGIGTLEPRAAGVDGALGTLLTIVHRAGESGAWARLKACREHTCEWAFYDHTKNRSGAWCNMAVCGNRAKARAYRERRGDH